METFAVIMLVLILVGWHHFTNWYLRLLAKDNDKGAGGVMFVLVIITIAITMILLYYIIKWGINLI